MKLSALKVKEEAVITEMQFESEVLSRLNALGLTIGVKVSVLAKSYFGSPIMIKIRNCKLGIRKETADKIKVEKSV